MNTFYIVFLLVLFYLIYNHNETFLQDNVIYKNNMNMTVFKQFDSIGISWYDENVEEQNTSYRITLLSEDGNDNNEYKYTSVNSKQFHTFIFPKNYNSNKQYSVKIKNDKSEIESQSRFFYIDTIKNNKGDNINYIKCNPDGTYNINKGNRNNVCKLDIFPMSKDEFIKSSNTFNEINSVLDNLELSDGKIITLDGTQ